MGNTLSIRLSKDLAEWLEETSRKTGRTRGCIVRTELERARKSPANPNEKPFMRWAGAIEGPKDLSMRKGFSRK